MLSSLHAFPSLLPCASITLSVWPSTHILPVSWSLSLAHTTATLHSLWDGFFWLAQALLLAGIGSDCPEGQGRVVMAAGGTVEPSHVRDS